MRRNSLSTIHLTADIYFYWSTNEVNTWTNDTKLFEKLMKHKLWNQVYNDSCRRPKSNKHDNEMHFLNTIRYSEIYEIKSMCEINKYIKWSESKANLTNMYS